ncbi:SipW-dependent-type signal peptide-containing protein [Nocardioides sp.]
MKKSSQGTLAYWSDATNVNGGSV